MSVAPLVLIPKNGLGNRLRAVASGLETARITERPLEVLWEPFDGSKTNPDDLFEIPDEFRFLGSEEAAERGIDSRAIPDGLSLGRNIVFLRGRDKGQQRYLPRFVETLRSDNHTTGVVVAGNYFHPESREPDSLDRMTLAARRELSKILQFNPEVKAHARNSRPGRRYLGLHLRASDRRKEVPSPMRVLARAVQLAKWYSLSEVFICSDSEETRLLGVEALCREGMKVFMSPSSPVRRDVEGEKVAGGDFLNLRGSTILVGARESTFATEAAVGNDHSRHVLLTRRSTGSARLNRLLRRRFGDSARFW